jgi:hypothetical protein
MKAFFSCQWIKIFTTFILLLPLTSCNDSKTNIEIPNVKGPTVSLEDDRIVITTTFEKIQISDTARYDIPKMNYSYLTLTSDPISTGTTMTVHISLQDILGDVPTLDPHALPGGRPLPGVASGALPAVAFTIPKFNNMTFYAGPEVFGAFLPVNVGMDSGIVSARFYIGGKRAGNISLVGSDENSENSGFLLMIDLKGKARRMLQKIQRQYAHRY